MERIKPGHYSTSTTTHLAVGPGSCGVMVGDITPDKWFFFFSSAELIIVHLLGKEETHYGA